MTRKLGLELSGKSTMHIKEAARLCLASRCLPFPADLFCKFQRFIGQAACSTTYGNEELILYGSRMVILTSSKIKPARYFAPQITVSHKFKANPWSTMTLRIMDFMSLILTPKQGFRKPWLFTSIFLMLGLPRSSSSSRIASVPFIPHKDHLHRLNLYSYGVNEWFKCVQPFIRQIN